MTPFFASSDVTIYQADSRTAWRDLPEQCADAIVTSPPYFGLRDYGVKGQIGLEGSPDAYVGTLADLLTGYGERVMKPGGSLWLNLGDSYAGAWGNYRAEGADPRRATLNGKHSTSRPATSRVDWPNKCLLMIPERVCLALIERGWILRNKVVWAKPNGMPSSVKDRLATKWEHVFHLVREPRYHYDLDAIREPLVDPGRAHGPNALRGSHSLRAAGPNAGRVNPAGANPGDVWTIATQPYPDAHFAVYPPELIRRPILATVPEGGTVLDPFFGSGTTGVMARRLGRKTVGVELNPDYCRLAADRFREDVLPLGEGVA